MGVVDHVVRSADPLGARDRPPLPTRDVDVVIVGSGPAGISTALHLLQKGSEWGERILVLDRAVHPRRKLCGGGVTHFGLRALTRLGLELEPRSFRVREVKFAYGDLSYSFRADPVLNIVDRAEFDHWLVREAADRGIRVREGESVVDVSVHPDHVLVTTDKERIRARCVVAADGSRSLVRRQVMGHDRSSRLEKLARLIEVETPEDALEAPAFRENAAVFDFSGMADGLQGYCWEFPSYASGEPVMSRGVFDSRVLPNRPGARLKRTLLASLRASSRSLDDYPIKGHPIRCYHPSNPTSRPRVLLVGDAAGVDPLLGEGISMALAYGEVAADAVVDAFSRNDFGFDDYQKRLHRHWLLWQLPWRARLAHAAYRTKHPMLVRMGWRIASVVVASTRWADPSFVPGGFRRGVADEVPASA